MENTERIDGAVQDLKDDEISLIDLFAVLLKYKRMIVVIVVAAMIFAVGISVISLMLPAEKSFLPNKYKASAHMLINDTDSSSSSLASAISSSGLGGLAGLAGISTGGSSNSSLAIYLVSSNPFLDAIVKEFNILEKPELAKSKFPVSDSRDMVKKQFSAETDDESGVFTISFTDIDPVFAQKVVDFSVDWISDKFDALGIDQNKIQKENLEKNIDLSFKEIQKLQEELDNIATSVSRGQSAWNIPSITLTTTKVQMELSAQQEVYKQLKTQYELLKVQMQRESPVFQILERPEIADKKVSPSRGKLCIIITFAAGFIAIFVAFLRNALENIKNDPEAMSKLTGSRGK